jgi:hypothetical protein
MVVRAGHPCHRPCRPLSDRSFNGWGYEPLELSAILHRGREKFRRKGGAKLKNLTKAGGTNFADRKE